MLKACTICGTPSLTGRCPQHPKPRSPSSKATSKWAHRKARARMLHGHRVCWICGEHIDRADLQADHLTPVSKGGEHGQMAPAHALCNNRRGNRGAYSL